VLQDQILAKLGEPIRQSPELNGSLRDLITAVQEQSLEGLVAKRRNSLYESGQRYGAWRKMRFNQGQEFVIGGYTPTASSFDALIFGYYDGDRLIYDARTRTGFTPGSRLHLMQRLRKLETAACPFANLPEACSGRRGEGLTAHNSNSWNGPRITISGIRALSPFVRTRTHGR
jgi:bifunctional non-homologous end joining protein LigD